MAEFDALYNGYDHKNYGYDGATVLQYIRTEMEANQDLPEFNIHGKVWVKLDADFQSILIEEKCQDDLLIDLIAQSAILAVAFTHADGTQNLVYTLHDATPARLAGEANE